MKRFFLPLLIFLAFTVSVFGQIPNGYYSAAEDKTGLELKIALYNIIKGHTIVSYDGLWNAFKFTDKKTNGKVWDMYSDIPGGTPPYEYTFTTNQCGNYNSEADCYNREHSMPKSWFNDASPMYSDLFHLYPTDGWVNGKRSNYPFGRVGSPTWTSLNGSKLGNSNYPGYSGVVFEPRDEYKGDFARTYFYMVTRYHNVVQNWSSDMLANNQFPAFTTWALNLLMEWHEADPVSQKEIDRNNVVYSSYQNNRNPFIDHPEYADLIWNASSTEVSFTSSPMLSSVVGSTYSYAISASSGTGSVTISCPVKPLWLTFTPTGSGAATLTGVPALGDVGSHPIQLVASNGTNQSTQNFEIVVSSSNVAPVIVSVDHEPETPYNFQGFVVTAGVTNDDGIPTVTLLWGESSLMLTNEVTTTGAGNTYTAMITIPAEIDELFYKIKATDDGGLTSFSEAYAVTILPNVAPSIYSITIWPEVPTEAETVQVRVLANDDDGDEVYAYVHWGLGPEELNNIIELTNLGGFFEGYIPQNEAFSTVYFKAMVGDIKGAQTLSSLHSFTVTSGSSINTIDPLSARVYPNPSSDHIFIHQPTNTVTSYTITDVYGRVILRGQTNSQRESVLLNGAVSGVYFLHLSEKNGKIVSIRFVVKK
jgi:endonuclease I